MTTYRLTRFFMLLVAAFALLFVTSCDSLIGFINDDGGEDSGINDDGGEDSGSSTRLTISGSLAAGAQTAVSALVSSGDGVTAANVDLSEVEQVMLFYGRSYVTAAVNEEGLFQIPVSDLAPSGIMLVGPDNSYGGVLSFGVNETSIPLQMTGDDVTAIDLGALDAGDDAATTDVDVDARFGLTTEERAAFSAASDFFESVMRNPDIDGNGVVDPLEDRYIDAYFQFNLNDWTIPAGQRTPDTTDLSVQGYNPYVLLIDPERDNDEIYASAGTLTFPDGTEVAAENAGGAFKFGNHTGLPAAGRYALALPDLNITFDYDLSADAAAGAFIYVVVPTVELNDDGTINRVTWAVVDLEGNQVDRAPLMLDTIYIGFDVAAEYAGEYGLDAGDNPSVQVYETPNIEATESEHVFETQGIAWAHISGAYTSSTDLFGNQYMTMITVEH